VHRTLSNLTKLPEPLIALIEAYCRGRKISVDAVDPVVGKAYGPLAATVAVAIERALGHSRLGKLALFLVLARVCAQGSRLSAVRWAEDQAVAEALGLGRFDEDDLYAALDELERRHERIELELARRAGKKALYLYDVTSSYLEGQKNELAQPGYSRDGKRYKKQVVVGLLTDATGEPVSVRVYDGNTSDPTTVADPVRLLAEELGAEDVIFVGDRGMLKSGQRQLLGEAGFRFLTALTDAQVRPLLRTGAVQPELFDETPGEVEHEGRRLILRLNPDTRERHRARRRDQLAKVQAKIDARNLFLTNRSQAKPETSLKLAHAWLAAYKLGAFVSARLEGRRVELSIDDEKRSEVELLDGCYVLETDAPRAVMPTQEAVDRYMGLQQVERDFRTMKTGLLEIRPIFLRKGNRTRAHALVTMLALKIVRAMRARLAPTGLTVRDALHRLQGVRLVSLGGPGIDLWCLPTRFAPPQDAILAALPPLAAPLLSLASDELRRRK
jgi:hypothetical protein